jgi:hypothetical protein
VKAPPRRGDGEPGGGEAQEGIGWCRRLNPDGAATDPGEERSPEGGVTDCGARWATIEQWFGANDRRARAVDETEPLHRGENP